MASPRIELHPRHTRTGADVSRGAPRRVASSISRAGERADRFELGQVNDASSSVHGALALG